MSNPRYVIIRDEMLHRLPAKVDIALADGVWQCVGAPFQDRDRGEWCQTVVRVDQTTAGARGTVKLKEPRR